MKKSTKATKATKTNKSNFVADKKYPFATLQTDKDKGVILIRAKHASLERAVQYANTRENAYIVNVSENYDKKWFKGVFNKSFHSPMVKDLTPEQKNEISALNEKIEKDKVAKKKARLEKKIEALKAQLAE